MYPKSVRSASALRCRAFSIECTGRQSDQPNTPLASSQRSGEFSSQPFVPLGGFHLGVLAASRFDQVLLNSPGGLAPAAISVTARGAPRLDAAKAFAKVHHLRVILHATFPARGSSLRTKAAPARSRCKEYRTPSWGIQKRPLADEAFLLKAASSMFFQFRSAVL